MSYLGNLSYEEKKAIEDLQLRVESVLTPKSREDPTLYYRFLKARDFDVDKAEKMLRKHINWRKAHQIDTLLEDFKPKTVFGKYADVSKIGLDKDGDLVCYSPSGKIVTKDVLKCMTINELGMHYVWIAEKFKAFVDDVNEKEGTKSSRFTLIVDLGEVTFANATSKASVEGMLKVTRLVEENYPERLKAMYVINAPSFFVLIFAVLNTVMSNAMIQKMSIFGHGGWKEKLLEAVDADVLPAFLGGNRTDVDGNPLCKSFIMHAEKIPPVYYLSTEDRYFKNMSQVQEIVVPQLGKKEISVGVTESGSIINWRFLVKNKDIGFGLSFETSDQKVKELLPIERYLTTDGTEEGSYRSEFAGKYIIIFDNSYSWLNSKEIQYSVSVVKPEQIMKNEMNHK